MDFFVQRMTTEPSRSLCSISYGNSSDSYGSRQRDWNIMNSLAFSYEGIQNHPKLLSINGKTERKMGQPYLRNPPYVQNSSLPSYFGGGHEQHGTRALTFSQEHAATEQLEVGPSITAPKVPPSWVKTQTFRQCSAIAIGDLLTHWIIIERWIQHFQHDSTMFKNNSHIFP